jgi:glycyl-tRNA synthetase alpha chain
MLVRRHGSLAVHLFPAGRGVECAPVAGELTYGLERLAMYVQGVDNVYDLNFNGRDGADKVTYGDVFLQAEQEYSGTISNMPTRRCCSSSSRWPKPPARRYLDARLEERQARRTSDGAAGL